MRTEGIVTLDLHGMNAYQAGVTVDAALRRAGGAYRLRVIHGYRQGDVLRNMILGYAAHPLVKRVVPGRNPGQTDLVLREL